MAEQQPLTGKSLAPSEALTSSSSLDKENALRLLATAYALLLANHGQLTSIAVKQPSAGRPLDFEQNLFSGFDREFLGQCIGRFTEAQMYVRRALADLGVSVRPRDGLGGVPSSAGSKAGSNRSVARMDCVAALRMIKNRDAPTRAHGRAVASPAGCFAEAEGWA